MTTLRGHTSPSTNIADAPSLALARPQPCSPTPHLHLHCCSPVDPHVSLCPIVTLDRDVPCLMPQISMSRISICGAQRRQFDRQLVNTRRGHEEYCVSRFLDTL